MLYDGSLYWQSQFHCLFHLNHVTTKIPICLEKIYNLKEKVIKLGFQKSFTKFYEQ